MGSHHRYVCGLARFGLKWDQFEAAERIYLSVGRSAFTSALAAEIIGKRVHQFSPTIATFKNNKVVIFDHDSPRVGYYGKPVPWYKFTEQWCFWYENHYLKKSKSAAEGSDGMAVHVEQ